MATVSKSVYNLTVFATNVYYKHKNDIFRDIIQMIESKDKTNCINTCVDTNEQILKIYLHYHNVYIDHQNWNKENNKVIYLFIKNKLENINVIHSNYNKLKNKLLTLIKNANIVSNWKSDYVLEIIINILTSRYNYNYFKTKKEMINKKPVSINNDSFIEHVRKSKYMLKKSEYKFDFKSMVNINYIGFVDNSKKKNKSSKYVPSEVTSDQNIIARFIYKFCITEINDKLPSDVICNIISKVFTTFTSYFGKLKKGLKANKPKYKVKGEKFIIPFYSKSFKIGEYNNQKSIRLTVGKYVSKNYKQLVKNNNLICLNSDAKSGNLLYVEESKMKYKHKNKKINKSKAHIIDNKYIYKKSSHIINSYYVYLPIDKIDKINNENISLVEVCPKYDGKTYKIHIKYDVDDNKDTKSLTETPLKNIISIDLGMKILMAIYDPLGKCNLLSGKEINNINEYFNRRINFFKSNAKRCNNKFTTDRIRNLFIKRDEVIDDYFNRIVNWLYETYPKKTHIVIGYNCNWKSNVNMGRKNNRKFYGIPYRKLLSKLFDKFGPRIIEREESYTSKCDALSYEEICKHKTYSGKRVKRGLFKSKTGRIINADINGAINILRKSLPNLRIREKYIYNPITINLRRH